MRSPTRRQWLDAYYFVMFMTIWVAYALRGWAISGRAIVYLALLFVLAAAAACIRVIAIRTSRDADGANLSLKQREVQAIADEVFERSKRTARE